MSGRSRSAMQWLPPGTTSFADVSTPALRHDGPLNSTPSALCWLLFSPGTPHIHDSLRHTTHLPPAWKGKSCRLGTRTDERSARMNKWTTTTMRARPHPRGDTTPSRTSTLTKLSRATPRASRLSNTTSHAPPTMTTLRTPPTITTRTHTPAAITSSNPEERLPLSLPCAQPDLL